TADQRRFTRHAIADEEGGCRVVGRIRHVGDEDEVAAVAGHGMARHARIAERLGLPLPWRRKTFDRTVPALRGRGRRLRRAWRRTGTDNERKEQEAEARRATRIESLRKQVRRRTPAHDKVRHWLARRTNERGCKLTADAMSCVRSL